MRRLSRHQPQNAFNILRTSCAGRSQDNDSSDLGRVLFFAGVAAWKTGLPNCAIGYWVRAVQLRKHRYAADHLDRFGNPYGMVKTGSTEHDDKQAFFGVHLSRYLGQKNSGRLGTRAEIDMIHDLLEDSWRQMRVRHSLDSLPPEAKIEIFRKTKVIFPFFEVPDALGTGAIFVNFNDRQRVSNWSRCLCGSGLRFLQCHGRTPGEDELQTGVF
jgi:hypothetical protein